MYKTKVNPNSNIFHTLILCLIVLIFSTCSRSELKFSIDAELSESLDKILQEAVKSQKLPGVVALVTNRDSVMYHSAFGVMDAAGKDSMKKDALFFIASMTKPITSLGIMMLVEDGELALDDPVAKYLSDFDSRRVLVSVNTADSTASTRPAARPATIRDLLRHTSGLGYTFSSPKLLKWTQISGRTALKQPLLHDPGEKWTYGSSTYFLGQIIEKVSGESLPKFLSTHIFNPIGMTDTSFDLAESDYNRMVALYQSSDSVLQGRPPARPYQPTIRGDYGLLSTADDYGRFLRLVLGGGKTDGVRLVTRETMAKMTRDHLLDITVTEQLTANPIISKSFPIGAGQDGFGLGFQISKDVNSTSRAPGSLSWAGLYNTHFWIDPTNDLGVVLMTQVIPFYDERIMEVLTEFEHTLYQDLTINS